MIVFPQSGIAQEEKNTFELYGFIMTDAGYNFNSMDPVWFDVMRPTKLPAYKNEFGPSGNFFFSVRQTRLGVRSSSMTRLGNLKTLFEFDLFGFGADAGQTTFHLIQAYAELGRFRVGQTPSVFMDLSVVPLTLDYWGPCSRTFNFNIQFRYTPVQTEKQELAFALERPGGTADYTDYKSFIELENVEPRFAVPNFTAHYRRNTTWGHTQAGGLLKWMGWEDQSDSTTFDLSGHDVGWGFNFSALVRASAFLSIKAQAVYGEGIQSYFADAPADVGLQSTNSPSKPFKGRALPIAGLYLFMEWDWNESLASTMGFGSERVDNSDLQDPAAFRIGQYGLLNFRWYPVPNVMAGIEYQFGRRENKSDGFHSVGNKIQISLKVNFTQELKK